MKKKFILFLCVAICHTLHAQQQDEDIRDYFMPEKKITICKINFLGNVSNIYGEMELWEENNDTWFRMGDYIWNEETQQKQSIDKEIITKIKITQNNVYFINAQNTKTTLFLKLPRQEDKNQWEEEGHIYTVNFEEQEGEKRLVLKDFLKETGALLYAHIYVKKKGYLYTNSMTNGELRLNISNTGLTTKRKK